MCVFGVGSLLCLEVLTSEFVRISNQMEANQSETASCSAWRWTWGIALVQPKAPGNDAVIWTS